MNSNDDLNKIKVQAQILVSAIDSVVNVDKMGKLDDINITEIATMIILMSNNFEPY